MHCSEWNVPKLALGRNVTTVFFSFLKYDVTVFFDILKKKKILGYNEAKRKEIIRLRAKGRHEHNAQNYV